MCRRRARAAERENRRKHPANRTVSHEVNNPANRTVSTVETIRSEGVNHPALIANHPVSGVETIRRAGREPLTLAFKSTGVEPTSKAVDKNSTPKPGNPSHTEPRQHLTQAEQVAAAKRLAQGFASSHTVSK
jgi:hypothetical protein